LQHPLVAGVRGVGLMIAVELTEPAAAAVEAASREAGFLVNAVAPDTIRLVPPLVLTDAQVAAFLDALPGVLDSAAGVASVPATPLTREDA
jgi:acetylornithine aminotransferase